jgi:hypothetical protein
LNYLCYIGFNTTRLSQKLSLIVSAATGILLLIMIPISTTITISNFIVKRSVKVSRTVTNVDDEDKIVYFACHRRCSQRGDCRIDSREITIYKK